MNILKIIAETLSINVNDISVSDTLDDIGADELDILEIVMDIERKLSVSIEDDAVSGIRTVSDIVRITEACLVEVE